MEILVESHNHFIYQCGEIEKGIFPEADPNTELYKVTNEKGVFYAVASGFTPYEVDKVPEEYYKFSYDPITGEFTEIEFPLSTEDRVSNLEDYTEELLYELCLMKLGLDDEDLEIEE